MNKDEYNALSDIIFAGDYPGYRPGLVEIPNGDGHADDYKKFAHIAPKYFKNWNGKGRGQLVQAFERAFSDSLKAAALIGVPEIYMPAYDSCNLRLLYYPANSAGALHTDFNLFTLMTYRDQPDRFISEGDEIPSHVSDKFPQLHYGELMEEIGLAKPQPHKVLSSDTPQHSAVFFSLPSHDAILPSGVTVGEWLNERIQRSRKAVGQTIKPA